MTSEAQTLSAAEFAAALRQAIAGVVLPDATIPRALREALQDVAENVGDDEEQAAAVRAARATYRSMQLHRVHAASADPPD